MLVEEFDKEYGVYFSILCAIARGRTTRNEIEQTVGRQVGGYLARLEEDYALIRRHQPLFAKTAAKTARYEENARPQAFHRNLRRRAEASAGLFGEYWEINEQRSVQIHPWFMTAAGNCLYAMNQMLLMEADGECSIGAGVPKEWKDWSFRLPAESGYEVDFAMKDGKVERLALRGRKWEGRACRDRTMDATSASLPRTVNVVLPDGSRRKIDLSPCP